MHARISASFFRCVFQLLTSRGRVFRKKRPDSFGSIVIKGEGWHRGLSGPRKNEDPIFHLRFRRVFFRPQSLLKGLGVYLRLSPHHTRANVFKILPALRGIFRYSSMLMDGRTTVRQRLAFYYELGSLAHRKSSLNEWFTPEKKKKKRRAIQRKWHAQKVLSSRKKTGQLGRNGRRKTPLLRDSHWARTRFSWRPCLFLFFEELLVCGECRRP